MKPYEINELVAEKVMGFEVRDGNMVRDNKRSGIPGYSQKIEYAWQVVEKLGIQIIPQSKGAPSDCKYLAVYERKPYEDIQVFNESAPLAICLAALKAVEMEGTE